MEKKDVNPEVDDGIFRLMSFVAKGAPPEDNVVF
jgi:hypothetical protein